MYSIKYKKTSAQEFLSARNNIVKMRHDVYSLEGSILNFLANKHLSGFDKFSLFMCGNNYIGMSTCIDMIFLLFNRLHYQCKKYKLMYFGKDISFSGISVVDNILCQDITKYFTSKLYDITCPLPRYYIKIKFLHKIAQQLLCSPIICDASLISFITYTQCRKTFLPFKSFSFFHAFFMCTLLMAYIEYCP